jgi:hypothetical protein
MAPKKGKGGAAPIFAAADNGDLEAVLAWCAGARHERGA